MQIKNSLDIPDWFLRRMVGWCCKEVGLPQRKLKLAAFRNSKSLWGGCARAWRGQITVCVGSAECFPYSCSTHEPGEVFHDRTECLVAVTAHEAYHIAARIQGEGTRGYGRRNGGHGSSERVTCMMEMRALRAFRSNRESLLAEWSSPPPALTKPVVPPQEKKAAKAQADLDRWTRKLRLAQTKVRKAKLRVAYYAKRRPVS